MNNYLFINQFLTMVLFSTMLLISNARPAKAQNDVSRSEHTFRFVYVAPDLAMDVNSLEKDLKTAHDYAMVNDDPAIFYLAGYEKPVIVEINIGKNNADDYEDVFIWQIRKNKSWNVENSDRKIVLDLLQKYNLFNAEGNLNWQRTIISFHVGRDFWEGEKNKTLIAPLFFDINAAKYIDDGNLQFNVNIYCPPNYDKFSTEPPFGGLNPDGINEKVPVRRNK